MCRTDTRISVVFRSFPRGNRPNARICTYTANVKATERALEERNIFTLFLALAILAASCKLVAVVEFGKRTRISRSDVSRSAFLAPLSPRRNGLRTKKAVGEETPRRSTRALHDETKAFVFQAEIVLRGNGNFLFLSILQRRLRWILKKAGTILSLNGSSVNDNFTFQTLCLLSFQPTYILSMNRY